MNDDKPILLSTEQAAQYLGVSVSFLAKARVSGKPEIPFVKIGSAVRYMLPALNAYIAANVRRSTSEADNAAA